MRRYPPGMRRQVRHLTVLRLRVHMCFRFAVVIASVLSNLTPRGRKAEQVKTESNKKDLSIPIPMESKSNGRMMNGCGCKENAREPHRLVRHVVFSAEPPYVRYYYSYSEQMIFGDCSCGPREQVKVAEKRKGEPATEEGNGKTPEISSGTSDILDIKNLSIE